MRGDLGECIRCAGFTLIELITAVVVVGVLSVLVVPGMQELVQSRRFTTASNDIVGVLTLARSEAIKRSGRVNVSALDGSDSSNEWGPGLRVWFDLDGDNVFDANEEIYVVPALTNSVTVDVFDNGGNDFSQIQFNRDGRLITGIAPMKMAVCDSSTIAEDGKEVRAVLSGQIKVISTTCS